MPREPRPSLLLRFAFLAAVAVWLGGLTFYGGIVVPVATTVLGSHREAGFVTRIVTLWLNGIGIAALLLLLVHLRGLRGLRSRAVRVARWSFAALVVTQALLLGLHPLLDAHLDPAAMGVDAPDTFYELHRLYLLATMVLWLAGVVHVAAVLPLWRAVDREG